jgi:transketolase
VTVEAHYVSGGIGSLVAEVIAENGLRCRLIRCAARDSVGGPTGSEPWLRRRHGLTAADLAAAVAAGRS